MKKILSFLLCIIIISASLAGCAKGPEIAEIEDRLVWLLDESAKVNDFVFGEGLSTYERIYDPLDTLKYYEDIEKDVRYYYYTFTDGDMKILAYRTRSYGTDFSYLEITKDASSDAYVYYDEASGDYYLPLPEYEEKRADFYYNSSVPEGYDVVVIESAMTIDSMKEYVESVYSRDYSEALYETLFVGAVAGESGFLGARYMEFTDDNGTVWLAESNSYEPLIKERRIYDLSTAQILRGSNSEYVRIAIESYLESTPEARLTVEIGLINQDGEWFLDSPTY